MNNTVPNTFFKTIPYDPKTCYYFLDYFPITQAIYPSRYETTMNHLGILFREQPDRYMNIVVDLFKNVLNENGNFAICVIPPYGESPESYDYAYTKLGKEILKFCPNAIDATDYLLRTSPVTIDEYCSNTTKHCRRYLCKKSISINNEFDISKIQGRPILFISDTLTSRVSKEHCYSLLEKANVGEICSIHLLKTVDYLNLRPHFIFKDVDVLYPNNDIKEYITQLTYPMDILKHKIPTLKFDKHIYGNYEISVLSLKKWSDNLLDEFEKWGIKHEYCDNQGRIKNTLKNMILNSKTTETCTILITADERDLLLEKELGIKVILAAWYKESLFKPDMTDPDDIHLLFEKAKCEKGNTDYIEFLENNIKTSIFFQGSDYCQLPRKNMYKQIGPPFTVNQYIDYEYYETPADFENGFYYDESGIIVNKAAFGLMKLAALEIDGINNESLMQKLRDFKLRVKEKDFYETEGKTPYSYYTALHQYLKIDIDEFTHFHFMDYMQYLIKEIDTLFKKGFYCIYKFHNEYNTISTKLKSSSKCFYVQGNLELIKNETVHICSDNIEKREIQNLARCIIYHLANYNCTLSIELSTEFDQILLQTAIEYNVPTIILSTIDKIDDHMEMLNQYDALRSENVLMILQRTRDYCEKKIKAIADLLIAIELENDDSPDSLYSYIKNNVDMNNSFSCLHETKLFESYKHNKTPGNYFIKNCRKIYSIEDLDSVIKNSVNACKNPDDLLYRKLSPRLPMCWRQDKIDSILNPLK